MRAFANVNCCWHSELQTAPTIYPSPSGNCTTYNQSSILIFLLAYSSFEYHIVCSHFRPDFALTIFSKLKSQIW